MRKDDVLSLKNLLDRETAPGSEGASEHSSVWPIKFKYCLARNREKLSPDAKVISEEKETVYGPYYKKCRDEGALLFNRTTRKTIIKDQAKFDAITAEHAAALDAIDKEGLERIDVDVYEYKGVTPETAPLDLYTLLLTAKIIPEPLDVEV
jgi:hypothetical protein